MDLSIQVTSFEMVVSNKCSLFMRVSVMRTLTVVIIHFLFRSNTHFIFIALPFSYCLLICVCKIHVIHAARGCKCDRLKCSRLTLLVDI